MGRLFHKQETGRALFFVNTVFCTGSNNNNISKSSFAMLPYEMEHKFARCWISSKTYESFDIPRTICLSYDLLPGMAVILFLHYIYNYCKRQNTGDFIEAFGKRS